MSSASCVSLLYSIAKAACNNVGLTAYISAKTAYVLSHKDGHLKVHIRFEAFSGSLTKTPLLEHRQA